MSTTLGGDAEASMRRQVMCEEWPSARASAKDEGAGGEGAGGEGAAVAELGTFASCTSHSRSAMEAFLHQTRHFGPITRLVLLCTGGGAATFNATESEARSAGGSAGGGRKPSALEAFSLSKTVALVQGKGLSGLEVSASPEPDEVLWHNLRYSESHRRRVEVNGMLLILLVIAAGVVALVALKWGEHRRVAGRDHAALTQLALLSSPAALTQLLSHTAAQVHCSHIHCSHSPTPLPVLHHTAYTTLPIPHCTMPTRQSHLLSHPPRLPQCTPSLLLHCSLAP